MDILIVGKYGVVTDALINKLNKEGNNVFVLMGEGYHGKKHRYVYEQYSFDYSSDSVSDVIGSVKPACVIFTGAYDSEFTWEHPNEDALRYVSAAMNIALTSSMLDVPHFICLSSNDVFEDSASYMIKEDDAVTAASAKGVAISQGEKICLGCASEKGMRVTVLRLDNLYGVPFRLSDIRSRCCSLCLEALREGSVKVDGNTVRSHLHLNDAAQAVLNVVRCPYPKYDIYHVTDSNPVSELDMGRSISDMDNSITLNDDTGTEQLQIVLSGERFNEEFSFYAFNPITYALPYIFGYMKNHSSHFIDPYATGVSWKQFIRRTWRAVFPFVENAACAVILGLAIHRFGGSQYVQRIDLFMIYTIIFGLLYGKSQGIFSSFLSIFVYIFSGAVSGVSFIDASTYVWIAMLFIIGMAVGHMKDMLATSTQDKDDEIEYLSGRLSDVNAINRSNMRIKDVLKNQIVSYDCSLATLYNVASKLDKANPIDVMFYAAEILQELLKARDVAIYRVVRGGFARLVTSTTQQGKKLGVSCDFEKHPEIYDVLKKHQVFVNNTMNIDLPMMVSAMYSDDEIDMVFVVWNLHYEQMTLYETNMLTVLGHMIHDSVSRSNRYIDAVEMQKYNGCSRILQYSAFSEMEEVYRSAAERGLAESSVLIVDDKDIPMEQLDEKLSHMIRESDFLGADDNGQVYILLSNASESESEIVIERMKKAGINCSLKR